MKISNPSPGYPITQVFGANPQLYVQFGLAGHNGLDFGTPVGTPIMASAPGIVTMNTPSGAYGLNIRIDHPCFQGIYAHLKDVTVSVGQEVEAEWVIGHSGGAVGDPNAGNSTGPHLHFEMRPVIGGLYQYGGAVDPLEYITNSDNIMQYKAITTASSLTVRTGPGSQYPVSPIQPRYLPYNTFVAVFSVVNNYAEIGPDRWVSVRYLKKI